MAGASVAQTVWHISMRLAWPAILGLGMFVFIRNVEAFDVPVLIGTPSRISLLTTDVYVSLTHNPPQLGSASAFSAVMLLLVAVLLSPEHLYLVERGGPADPLSPHELAARLRSGEVSLSKARLSSASCASAPLALLSAAPIAAPASRRTICHRARRRDHHRHQL